MQTQKYGKNIRYQGPEDDAHITNHPHHSCWGVVGDICATTPPPAFGPFLVGFSADSAGMGWTHATHSSAAVRSLLAYLCQGENMNIRLNSHTHTYTLEEGAILLCLAETINEDLGRAHGQDTALYEQCMCRQRDKKVQYSLGMLI